MISISDLHTIAEGLNIEGGYPYHYLIRDNPNKKVLWANIILILDRPLIDNILFEELDKKMKEESYLLLENTIDEINEHNMFAIYLTILCYYLENGKKMLGKSSTDKLHITVHIHQDIVGMNINNLLKKYLCDVCQHFNIAMTNIILEYRTDKFTFVSSEHDYTDTDILISLSQCAGLGYESKPGDMIIPETFIPYDVTNKTINIKESYKIKNHLIEILNDILFSKYHNFSIEYINDNYESANKNKKHNAMKLHNIDFIVASILQVNALWNPTDLSEMVKTIIKI